MRKEERWPMYFVIQEQKRLGLRKSQVARNLNISRNTVIKFWNTTVDEYKQFMEGLETRSKKLESFEPEIVNGLRQYPDLSAAQVMDWLKERHKDIEVAESTVQSYVRGLRIEYAIPKMVRIRQYEAVEELPMGRQMQMDFGETKLRHPEGHLDPESKGKIENVVKYIKRNPKNTGRSVRFRKSAPPPSPEKNRKNK